MKFTALNTGPLVLLFALSVANGHDLQLPQAGNGLQLASATSSARFQEECSQCHGDADEFVRESLTFKNGVLTGQSSEMPLVDFLNSHRKLKPDDVNFYADLLTRVAGEIGLQ